MNLNIQIKEEGNSILSFFVSAVIHAAILLIAVIIINLNSGRPKINPSYVQVVAQQPNLGNAASPKDNSEKLKDIIQNKSSGEKLNPVNQTEVKNSVGTFSELNADTTDLDQTYKESTLNVTIKYPAGWTFLDQDVRNKLDGVTFWSSAGNFQPPPYIHLEVKDKELFSPGRYRYKTKMGNFELYYNDPEVLENQYSQTIYIRTESDEDFSLRLIMVGKDAFRSFQPVFFGMIKTFKFGSPLF